MFCVSTTFSLIAFDNYILFQEKSTPDAATPRSHLSDHAEKRRRHRKKREKERM
jgi:hypothetical protein